MTTTLEEAISKMNDGTYDFTCNGKCIGCGACCSNILPMTDEEIKRIKSYIKRYNIKECKHQGTVLMREPVLDMTCPFMDDSKTCDKCTIYEIRPRICRDFICDPKQRPKVDMKYGLQCMAIDVRQTFFGKG
ncbi:MAG: YkgJ family cysteine cluster protein [Bacteroidales bacterium]|nr:YkgJ family cysteine cluster protein [Candidatus Scybalousia scybalohippi]